MTQTLTGLPDQPDGRNRTASGTAHAVVACFLEHGYSLAEPALLQPASVFLDLSGEDIRSRLFITSDDQGHELCLRPEYTIPVCRDYLAGAHSGKPAAYAYSGPVFRVRAGESGEFVQSGVENFGREDFEAADADLFALCLQAANAPDLKIKIGDTALLSTLLHQLDLSPFWLRRIKRGLAAGKPLASIFDLPPRSLGHDHSGVLKALEGVDRKGARALVEDLLSIAGISTVGGRSVGEIADRFLEQSAMKSDSGLSADKRAILERFLTISGHPDSASIKLRVLAREAKLDFSDVLDAFDMRNGFIAAHGIALEPIEFSTAFARNLDYYTGFVFEARHTNADRPSIGGGRYDRLLKALGAPHDIPAVGAAVWIDRLNGAMS